MSYRHLKVQKKVGGKIRRYKNLAAFNKECGSRGVSGNICTLTNIRKLKDGSGLATIKTEPGAIGRHKSPKTGTWLLHFASHDLMKRHLKKRVDTARAGMLDGAPLCADPKFAKKYPKACK